MTFTKLHSVRAGVVAALAFLAPLGISSAQSAELTEVRISAIGPALPMLDTVTAMHRATRRCGPQFRCRKGWDVAVLGVRTSPVVVKNEPATVRALVMNSGSLPSPSIPAVVRIGDASVRWTVPELGANDSVEVAIRVTPTTRGYDAKVTLDPDQVTGEVNSENNKGEAELATEEEPRMELGEWRGMQDAVRAGRPVRLAITIRNTRRAVALRNGTLLLYFTGSGLTSYDRKIRVAVPVIEAQHEMSAVVVLTHATDAERRLESSGLLVTSMNLLLEDGSSASISGQVLTKIMP